MSRVGKTLLRKMSGAPGYCDDNRALFVFEGAVNGDYGSGRRILQYFRKVGAGRRAWGAEFTEVGGEICFTSVNFDSGKEELSADYGSSRRNLQYFRKVGAGRRGWGAEFTEVGREICFTSVNFGSG